MHIDNVIFLILSKNAYTKFSAGPQSMSRVGRCIDNGPMEGFWGILKCEMYYLNYFDTYEELVSAVEQFIYYYNHQRRQHKLNRLPPATYRSLLEAA